MAKKKGPPYTDDPGCKYIVIEDPWPGNPSGDLKARNQVYFNHLCTWVYFMFGKAHEAEAVFSVNTRSEVIVRLAEHVDITPVLGAHPWRRFLARGDARDKDRVSYIFEYNYRMKGEPSRHNWVETYPTVSGDPPPHLRFPVLFPYPHVSWATPKGKNCVDLALPLPPTRQPTPVPDTSGFVPYQHPSQLTESTVDNARSRLEDVGKREQKPSVHPASTSKLGKLDPYEDEANALRSLRSESLDARASVKREPPDSQVKAESGGPVVKHEPEPYGPSKSFRNAVERLQQARRNSEGGSSRPVAPTPPAVKEEAPPAPSPSFVEAFQRIRGRPAELEEGPRIKQDASEKPVPSPSESFKAAFERIRGIGAASGVEVVAQTWPIRTQEGRVKSEPEGDTASYGAPPPRPPDRNTSADPRLAAKRVKEEDGHERNERKRFKSEAMY
ncbi:hypothetical protein OH77DRAFT_1423483 [Trametes cingulata]|nr:hypothetical protein OH77DRAFT_1423483 [Trametes cingulata]